MWNTHNHSLWSIEIRETMIFIRRKNLHPPLPKHKQIAPLFTFTFTLSWRECEWNKKKIHFQLKEFSQNATALGWRSFFWCSTEDLFSARNICVRFGWTNVKTDNNVTTYFRATQTLPLPVTSTNCVLPKRSAEEHNKKRDCKICAYEWLKREIRHICELVLYLHVWREKKLNWQCVHSSWNGEHAATRTWR